MVHESRSLPLRPDNDAAVQRRSITPSNLYKISSERSKADSVLTLRYDNRPAFASQVTTRLACVDTCTRQYGTICLADDIPVSEDNGEWFRLLLCKGDTSVLGGDERMPSRSAE